MELLSNLRKSIFFTSLLLAWFCYIVFSYIMAGVMTWTWFIIDGLVLYYLVKWMFGAVRHRAGEGDE